MFVIVCTSAVHCRLTYSVKSCDMRDHEVGLIIIQYLWFFNFSEFLKQTAAESAYSRLKNTPNRTNNSNGSLYTRSRDYSSAEETLILPTPPVRRPTTAINGTGDSAAMDLKQKQPHSRETSKLPDSSQSYFNGFVKGDVMSQTCPPGETGRYLKHSRGRDPRESFERQPKYVNYPLVQQLEQNGDLLNNAPLKSYTRKMAPKKPARKKVKKTEEESKNIDNLLMEQMKLEKELKELQQIREKIVPPLDLSELNANHASYSDHERYLNPKSISTSSPSVSSQGRHPKDFKVSSLSSGHFTSGPSSLTVKPELTSDDSIDREVEGLLSEMLFLRDDEDDTSPLKHDSLSPEVKTYPYTNGAQSSSPKVTTNGYYNGVHEPKITNNVVDSSPSSSGYTPPPAGSKKYHSRVSDVSQDKIEQFCALKQQEMYWMNRIRHQRQILAQPLNTVVRHEVEEQYFYAQEQLSGIEKAIADLFQHLSPGEVEVLVKNGVVKPDPEYILSTFNSHSLQTNYYTNPSYNQFGQRSLAQQPQQNAAYPLVPGPATKGINVPQRFGYQQTTSQTRFATNLAPFHSQRIGNAFTGFQETSIGSGNVSNQTGTRASDVIVNKPASVNKETQTANGVHAHNGTTTSNILDRDLKKTEDNSDEVNQRERTRNISILPVSQNTSTKLPQAEDSEQRISNPVDITGLSNEASPVNQIAVGKQEDQPSGEFVVQGADNEKEYYVAPEENGKLVAVKRPSFDDHEVVKLKEKLEFEQKELSDSLKREEMRFLEEQRRLKEEEERQNQWMAEQENRRRRIQESLTIDEREVEMVEQQLSVDEVKNRRCFIF